MKIEAFPKRIVCLTEESVETLYLLGKEELIVGVSIFVERPPAAKLLPKVTQFTNANCDKILALAPDLVLGFSDIQKDIARELIEKGLNVFITNQRSLEEILQYVLMLGRMVGAEAEAEGLVLGWKKKIASIQAWAKELKKRPRIYFEEWDEPAITAIRWVSELFEICGAEMLFKERSLHSMAKGRFVSFDEVKEANPDIIIACWCGKKVKIKEILGRPGWNEISALKEGHVIEADPAIFLQPGPALFLAALDQAKSWIEDWSAGKK